MIGTLFELAEDESTTASRRLRYSCTLRRCQSLSCDHRPRRRNRSRGTSPPPLSPFSAFPCTRPLLGVWHRASPLATSGWCWFTCAPALEQVLECIVSASAVSQQGHLTATCLSTIVKHLSMPTNAAGGVTQNESAGEQRLTLVHARPGSGADACVSRYPRRPYRNRGAPHRHVFLHHRKTSSRAHRRCYVWVWHAASLRRVIPSAAFVGTACKCRYGYDTWAVTKVVVLTKTVALFPSSVCVRGSLFSGVQLLSGGVPPPSLSFFLCFLYWCPFV